MDAGRGVVAVGSFDTDPASLQVTDLLDAFNTYVTGTFGGERVADADGALFISSDAIIPDSFNGADVYIFIDVGSEFAVISAGRTFPDENPNDPVPIAFDLNLVVALNSDGVVPRLGCTTNNQNIAVLDALGATPGPSGVGLLGVLTPPLRCVPEPSIGCLFGIGAAIAITRRRRAAAAPGSEQSPPVPPGEA